MNIRVQPNNHLPQEAIVQGGKKTAQNHGLWTRIARFGVNAKQWASKPTILGGFNINPLSPAHKGPSDALRRIDDFATQGLKRAQISNVPTDTVAGRFHAELDRLLQSDKIGSQPKDAHHTVGPVAVIPTLPLDPEVTKAIPLQARLDDTDWKKEMDNHRDVLARKASAFGAAWEMRDLAGIQEEDNLNLMRIVERTTKVGSTETLCDAFINLKDKDGKTVYNLSFFDKIKVGWFYWTAYQTSLIDNTVGAILKKFFEGITEGLTSADDKPRLKLIRAFLEEVNEFLIEDMGATKAFANAIEPDGDVEKYRDRTIKRRYGKLEDLCKKFSEASMKGKAAPWVPILDRFHKIPVIGLVSKAFEWVVNRFIIQRVLKNSILPPGLKSLVENSLEATEPHNLPFALALTRFFNKQIDALRVKLNSKTSTPLPPELPGTEIVSPLIKHLMCFLELEPLKTQSELKHKFQEIDNGKRFDNRKIEEYIQAALKESFRSLFEHLNKTAASGELSANLLQLTCATFSPQVTDYEAQLAEFKEEELKLKKSAGGLFKQIIHQAIDEKFGGSKPEDAKEMAAEAFQDEQNVAKLVFKGKQDENGVTVLRGLVELCQKMTEKIDRSAQAPTPENNIQPDIAAFLQTIQVYGNHKKIQDRIDSLEKNDRAAIWRLVTPLYERAGNLVDRVLVLQELQDEYPAHTAVTNRLKFIKQLIESIRNQFHAQPRHLRNPLTKTLERTCDEIGKSLGEKAPATLRLKGYIKSISDLTESIANEQEVIDAIHAFYPPRELGQVVEQEGLLEQLLHYEQGVSPPTFQPKACRAELAEKLKHFPAEEQRQLREVIGDGRELAVKWAQLSPLLQGIYERHRATKDLDSAKLEEALRIAQQWTEEKIGKYTLVKDENHTAMQREMREISAETLHLRDDINRTNLELPFYFSSQTTKIMSATAGIGIGVGLTALGAAVAGPAGAAIGAGMSSAIYTGTQNLSNLIDLKPGAWTKTVGSFAAGTTAAYTGSAVASYIGGTRIFNAAKHVASYIPGLTTTVAMIPGAPDLISGGALALTGLNVEQAAHNVGQDKALPQVMKIFENAYEAATRSPRIPHAALTRAMLALSAGA
jgi:hypothetical protein